MRLGIGIAYTFGERGAKQAAEAGESGGIARQSLKKAMEEAKCEEARSRRG
jgi:hypothetical protein